MFIKNTLEDKQLFLYFTDLTARLSWINWENLGVNPSRRGVLTSYSIPDNVNN